MKRLVIIAALVLFSVSYPTPLNASKPTVSREGRAWLDAYKDPAEVNVNGAWDSDEWGTLHLIQAEGSRDVTGTGAGYELIGVVSGKRLYLLFSSGGRVEYCAVLSPQDRNSFVGTYSNRSSKKSEGLCQKYTRPMFITKR